MVEKERKPPLHKNLCILRSFFFFFYNVANNFDKDMLCPCIFIVRGHHCFYRQKYICRQKNCVVLKNIIRLDSCQCLFSLFPMYWCRQKFWVSTNVSYVAKKALSQHLLFLTLTKNPIPHYFSSHFLKNSIPPYFSSHFSKTTPSLYSPINFRYLFFLPFSKNKPLFYSPFSLLSSLTMHLLFPQTHECWSQRQLVVHYRWAADSPPRWINGCLHNVINQFVFNVCFSVCPRN